MAETASKIIEFIALAQCVFKDTGALTLKNRFLFALKDNPLSPKNLSDSIKQDKTNVAHLAADLLRDGLIIKSGFASDRRAVRYCLTDAGRAALNSVLLSAEKKLASLQVLDGDTKRLETALDEALRLLSFL
jgi:DNA-binding MarR family transcriptional regulator